ncbi:MAG: hypothetical protein CMF19_08400 [Idiomarinaceae bacterium]|nr:hypothetical protein [Idiomarinaceae bacterium]
MAKTTNHRILNPVTATTREVAEVLNRTVDGKLNSTGGPVTLSGGSDVTVTDPRAGKESVILLVPLNSHYYKHEPYIKTKNNGSFVIGQKNHGHDGEADYVIIG